MEKLDRLKLLVREEEVPYFSDEELEFYLEENAGDVSATAYQCLILKAEDTTLSASGLSVADSSKYFRRLASHYRPSNSGILRGGA